MIDNILPRTIANRLKEVEMNRDINKDDNRKCCIIGSFDDVTILFVKLVGFTSAVREYHPYFVIGQYLRDVFMEWEELCAQKTSVENIKTIADSFMVVGGLGRGEKKEVQEEDEDENDSDEDTGTSRGRKRNNNNSETSDHERDTESESDVDSDAYSTRTQTTHPMGNKSTTNKYEADDVAVTMVTLGMDMQKALDRINNRYQMEFKCQIGIHSGSVIAGVIGVNKFAFDVWGDAVNTASRMESYSIPGHLHMSLETYQRVKYSVSADSNIACRGEIEVKGKGKMETYIMPLPSRLQFPILLTAEKKQSKLLTTKKLMGGTMSTVSNNCWSVLQD